MASNTRSLNRTYWVCQLVGWGLYILVTIPELRFAPGMRVSLGRALFETCFAAALGIASTHAFRAWVRPRGWLKRRFPALGLRMLGMGFLLAAVVILPLSAVEFGLYGDRPRFLLLVIALAELRWTAVFFVWQVLYFNITLLRHRERAELERARLEAEVHAAELRALRSQLNPHFLFNALNGVRALIEADPARAREAVTQLSALLRYALAPRGEETVTLGRELEVVESYLALERLRLASRLAVAMEISPEARDARVPPLLVQTLVENGIKHGISQRPEGGELRVRARIEDRVLQLEVCNPVAVADAAPVDGQGVGLKNAAERLARLFGNTAALQFQRSSELATARVSIPVGPCAR